MEWLLVPFTFMHLADAFIQSNSGYTFFLSVCVFPGNRTHNLCDANAMLYHWATGTLPDGLVWVYQKLLIYWDFHAQPSLGFTEYGLKKRKYPVSGSCVDENALLMSRGHRRMGRLVRDDRKVPVTKINTRYNQGMQNTTLNAQHVEPWSRWATAAEDHTGCRSCQLRTGNRGYKLHRLTNIGQ